MTSLLIFIGAGFLLESWYVSEVVKLAKPAAHWLLSDRSAALSLSNLPEDKWSFLRQRPNQGAMSTGSERTQEVHTQDRLRRELIASSIIHTQPSKLYKVVFRILFARL